MKSFFSWPCPMTHAKPVGISAYTANAAGIILATMQVANTII